MKKNKIFSLVILFLLSTQFKQSGAQTYDMFGFNFTKPKKKQIEYPFELKANLVIIKAVIDHSDTLNFILDTGVRGIIVLDTTITDQINVSYSRPIKIKGLGPNEIYDALISTGHTIQFGGIKGNFQNIVILQEDLVTLSDFIGTKVHGVIGSDLFNRFNIKINYLDKRLTFSDPTKYIYKKRKGEKIDLFFEKTKPYIKSGAISVKNKLFDSLNLVIDTGGSHALLLNEESVNPAIIPENLVDGNLGRGLSGKLMGKLGRIEELSFGKKKFKNVIAAFPENYAMETESERYALFRQGSIGGEILKRFIVTFNYSQSFMVLKPITSEIKKPFLSDMSGIDLKHNSDGEFEVVSVVPNSAAEKGGLLPGDKIIIINKRPTAFLSLSDIYLELRKKEGNSTFLIIRRGNQLEEINFSLEKII